VPLTLAAVMMLNESVSSGKKPLAGWAVMVPATAAAPVAVMRPYSAGVVP